MNYSTFCSNDKIFYNDLITTYLVILRLFNRYGYSQGCPSEEGLYLDAQVNKSHFMTTLSG
jgi:hypothetical protein